MMCALQPLSQDLQVTPNADRNIDQKVRGEAAPKGTLRVGSMAFHVCIVCSKNPCDPPRISRQIVRRLCRQVTVNR